MSDSIVVKNLSKQYRIGEYRETMLGDALRTLIKHRFRRPPASSDTIWALKDVSFTVKEGEAVGIIGRNGAGKSTLLKVLSRITYPTSGSVMARGHIASLLEVGTGFHEELTGRENIYLNGSILGMSRKQIEAQYDSIVAFSGVERFIDTPIKRYSSGMRVRLGFAVAAHLDPEILLVDEVLAVGDGDFQKKCLRAMDSLRSGGRTVLFVSHNLVAVENLCRRAIWIDNGQIRQDGPAPEVIEAYMSSFATAEPGNVDLKRADRRGIGGIRYTGIDFLDSSNRPKNLIRSGDSLVVRLHYDAEQRIANPIFGFEIYTNLGTRLTKVSTWAAGFDILAVERGSGHIDVELPFLNLMPARYYLSLWLESLVGASPIDFDVLDHCVPLDVEPSDAYGSGRGIDSYFGVIFLPCKWTLQV
jgi:homopolymeric O-antigen transport system ATP-binding protein